jgi:hypothetical protein
LWSAFHQGISDICFLQTFSGKWITAYLGTFLFKQDDKCGRGAPPHFGREVTEYLNANNQWRCIGRGGLVLPPRSQDLASDFFMGLYGVWSIPYWQYGNKAIVRAHKCGHCCSNKWNRKATSIRCSTGWHIHSEGGNLKKLNLVVYL